MKEEFICPENLFNGDIKKGTIYVKVRDNDSICFPTCIKNSELYTLPPEIVTKWKKVEYSRFNISEKELEMQISALRLENDELREEIKNNKENRFADKQYKEILNENERLKERLKEKDEILEALKSCNINIAKIYNESYSLMIIDSEIENIEIIKKFIDNQNK